MALVTRVSPDDREVRSLQPTQVECRYLVKEIDGRTLLQLNTYGSEQRQIEGKLSQTLQFDESSARQLWDVLRSSFGLR
jgi:hypothetical protein